MTAEPKKVLVVGMGSIGTRHARVLREAGHDVAVHSARAEVRTSLRNQGWNVVDAFSDFPGCHHAIVATRTGRHVEDTVAQLEAGMDVLVEKPLAVGLKQGLELASAAAKLNRKIYCGFNLRFYRSLNLFRSWLTRAGNMHAAHVECRSYVPDWRPGVDLKTLYTSSATEGGVLRDLAHEIDYAGWILGWPIRLTSRLDRSGRLGMEAEEAAYLDCELPSGANLQMDLDFLSRIPIRKIRVFGGEGTLAWDGMTHTVEFQEPGKDPECVQDKETKDENLLGQDLAFLAGEENRLVSLGDALRGLAVSDAARRSADSRREETIDYSNIP